MNESNENTLLAVCVTRCQPQSFPVIVRAVEAKDYEDAYEWALQFVRDRQPGGVLGKYTAADGSIIDGKEYVLNFLKHDNAFEFNEGEYWYDLDYTDIETLKDAVDQTTIAVQIKEIERY